MPSGVKDYDISLDNGATVYATTADRSLVVSGRTPGTLYPCRVRARDNAGNVSAWSSVVNVTTTGATDTTAPTVPTGLGSSTITHNTATVSWTASTDNVAVTKYQVEVNSSVLANESTTLNRALTGLTSSASQSVRVRAGDAAGNWSAWTTAHTFSTSAAPSGPTPLAAYAFSEGSGTTSADAIGTRHLTVASGNWTASGHTGSGVSSAGGVITIPSKAGLETAQRTLMFWANYPDASTIRHGVQFYHTALDTSGWGIVCRDSDAETLFRIRIGGVNTSMWVPGAPTTGWHHYAMSYDGTTLRGYRDGVQVGSQSVSGTIDAADTIRLAGEGGANLFDDVRFYNTALTATQVQDAMNAPV